MSLSAAAGRRPGLVMDLDGTVWIGGRMIAGALDCLRWLKETGFPLVYLTNNPVRPEGYASRLSMHGLPTEPDEVMTASTILKDHLLEVMPRARLFVLADAADYAWAKEILARHDLAARCPVHFSPVWGSLSPETLSAWILADRLPVRLGLQLHKIVWGADTRGV